MLGKPAAVKVLLPELSNNREIVNRFFNEARAATSVRHPGIVEIFDFGYMPSGLAYIVMELLDGESLSRVLVARGRLSEQEALVYTRGIASALAPAHAQGIVHRDLKPDNIFLVRDPDMLGGLRPKILDFGIAKVTEAQRIGGVSKTRTGAVLGTPTYMSPEQCRGTGEIDARSDLYAVGCILYEMLVGRPPFALRGHRRAARHAHVHGAAVAHRAGPADQHRRRGARCCSSCRSAPTTGCSRPTIWPGSSARARCPA
jgi:serine/threonine protein kinase